MRGENSQHIAPFERSYRLAYLFSLYIPSNLLDLVGVLVMIIRCDTTLSW